MNPIPKEQGLTDAAIQEFLDNGGEIVHCEPGARTENLEFKSSFYGGRRKKQESDLKSEQ
jgi:hypothetical protein|tara:strand:+ start:1009 stop:1188 length:180 start_codon:yes stop_codon:yes gene_type:complete